MNSFLKHVNLSTELEGWIASWPDGIIALDNQMRILYLSDKASEFTAWQNHQVVGSTIHDIFCTQSRNNAHSREDCRFLKPATGLVEPVSDIWLKADGHYLSVDFRYFSIESPGNTCYIVVFTSNTDRLHNQAEMEKFAEYADKNPMAIAEFDREGQMLYCNPAMQQQLLQYGFDNQGQAVFLPKTLLQICAAQTGDGVVNTEVQIEACWFNWHFIPLDDQLEGKAENNILAFCADITRQKQIEIDLNSARAEARRNFYAKMVHELRTPLNAIIGFSDILLLRSAAKFEERDKRALRTIKVAGIQLNEMVSDTLDLSKIEAGKMQVDLEHFFVSDVLEDIHDQIDYLAEAKKLHYEYRCELTEQVFSDKPKLRQILVNLISNAIKYTKIGKVNVSITAAHAAKLNPEAQGAYFSLRVSDTGIGIPEEKIVTLFGDYEQVRSTETREIQGTGIGLSLVRELTALLQGVITVESTLGIGSNFTVELPLALGASCPG